MAVQKQYTGPVDFEPLLTAIEAVTKAMGASADTLRAAIQHLDDTKKNFEPCCRRAHVVKDPDLR